MKNYIIAFIIGVLLGIGIMVWIKPGSEKFRQKIAEQDSIIKTRNIRIDKLLLTIDNLDATIAESKNKQNNKKKNYDKVVEENKDNDITDDINTWESDSLKKLFTGYKHIPFRRQGDR